MLCVNLSEELVVNASNKNLLNGKALQAAQKVLEFNDGIALGEFPNEEDFTKALVKLRREFQFV